VGGLLCTLATLYLFAVFARIVLSWIPTSSGGVMASVNSFLFSITEPVMGPLRRVLPPIGAGGVAIDLSPIVLILGMQFIVFPLLGC
jgi:YggT family protein